ncbi:MAG: hypothetical protein CMP11_05505 [Zetaproteobacteria bacterium]|nr:hypothetical protein [Pseudobdellovibrionaceae bacterium]|tara:strand:- start:1308 stop:1697 length:390 start_codon:yes stop_codon:yes gene_type:complete
MVNTPEATPHGRVMIKRPVEIVLCSIGSDVTYDLSSKNLSAHGFFIEFDEPGRFPFTTSSLLEVWIKISDEQTVFFNGKIDRIAKKDETSDILATDIYVEIVQITAQDQEMLKNFISENTDNIDLLSAS